jgi:hypothetical protein
VGPERLWWVASALRLQKATTRQATVVAVSDDVLLDGFAFTGFRSFSGDQLQVVGPLSKVHLLAGPNNSGKSNVLAVAQRVLPSLARGGNLEFGLQDVPFGSPTSPGGGFRIAVGVPLDLADVTEIYASKTVTTEAVRAVLAGKSFRRDSDTAIWFEFVLEGNSWAPSPEQLKDGEQARERSPIGPSILSQLSGELTSTRRGGGDAIRVLTRLATDLSITGHIPPVVTISAFRQIGPGSTDTPEEDYNGPGLIDKLAQLQNPTYDRPEDKKEIRAGQQLPQNALRRHRDRH